MKISKRRKLQGLVILIALIGLLYVFFLGHAGLDTSAALYIGLPLLLVCLVALSEKSKSVAGLSVKAMLYLMLLSVPVLQEGTICLVFAAPILLSLAGGIGSSVDYARKRDRKSLNWITIVIALAAVEGTVPQLSFDRNDTVTVTKVVPISPQAVSEQLRGTPSFDENRSWLTRIFPAPVAVSGQSEHIGDRHSVTYLYYKHLVLNPHKGETVFEVDRLNPGLISWRVISDSSYLATYLSITGAQVSWQDAGNGTTEVTWQVSYERNLDPAWYFGPIERFYVGQGAKYMIEHIAGESAIQVDL